MKSFTSFLREEASEAHGEKLNHIEHLEDHVLNDGHKGFEHAFGALEQAHHHIISGAHDSSLTMKHDGSPSLVYGTHPETGKFFVASKSAFNKSPKINYTPEDIKKNHGHTPGLADKLTHALEHLPKIAPEHGVHHGDLLFSGTDKKREGENYKFTPNTITYSASKHSEDGKKIKRAKLGVYNHTQYVGKTAKSLTANYSPDFSNFKKHPDVYHREPGHDTSKVKMTGKQHLEYAEHTKAAKALHDKHGEYMYDAMHNPESSSPLKDHMKSYINSTVDTQEKPSVGGLQKHLETKYGEHIDKMKTNVGRKKHQDELASNIKHTKLHNQNLENVLGVHHHLQSAKNVLVNALSQHTGGLEHEIRGQKVKPEGFVINHNGKLSKLNDRNEFNRLNRLTKRK
jgi:Family of unknown function (DUF6267)